MIVLHITCFVSSKPSNFSAFHVQNGTASFHLCLIVIALSSLLMCFMAFFLSKRACSSFGCYIFVLKSEAAYVKIKWTSCICWSVAFLAMNPKHFQRRRISFYFIHFLPFLYFYFSSGHLTTDYRRLCVMSLSFAFAFAFSFAFEATIMIRLMMPFSQKLNNRPHPENANKATKTHASQRKRFHFILICIYRFPACTFTGAFSFSFFRFRFGFPFPTLTSLLTDRIISDFNYIFPWFHCWDENSLCASWMQCIFLIPHSTWLLVVHLLLLFPFSFIFIPFSLSRCPLALHHHFVLPLSWNFANNKALCSWKLLLRALMRYV